MSAGDRKPKAGWDCYGDCGRSIADGITLHRTRPKGQPGDFMCSDCVTARQDERPEFDPPHMWEEGL